MYWYFTRLCSTSLLHSVIVISLSASWRCRKPRPCVWWAFVSKAFPLHTGSCVKVECWVAGRQMIDWLCCEQACPAGAASRPEFGQQSCFEAGDGRDNGSAGAWGEGGALQVGTCLESRPADIFVHFMFRHRCSGGCPQGLPPAISLPRPGLQDYLSIVRWYVAAISSFRWNSLNVHLQVFSHAPPLSKFQDALAFIDTKAPVQRQMLSQIPQLGIASGERFLNHRLSCDIDVKVQEFIRKTQHPQVLISDIQEASKCLVHNLLDEQVALVPSSTACVCSWVCHDLSLVRRQVLKKAHKGSESTCSTAPCNCRWRWQVHTVRIDHRSYWRWSWCSSRF